jgi:hypothetical protein
MTAVSSLTVCALVSEGSSGSSECWLCVPSGAGASVLHNWARKLLEVLELLPQDILRMLSPCFLRMSSCTHVVLSVAGSRADVRFSATRCMQPVSGISQAAVSGAAIAAAGQNGGPNYNTPFAARGSPVAGARPSLGSDPRVLPGGHTPLMNGGPAGVCAVMVWQELGCQPVY